jgi:hypothetical protein
MLTKFRLLPVASVSLSFSVASAEPRVTDAVLRQDTINKPGGYETVKPGTVFCPDTVLIAGVFKMEGAWIGTTVPIVWIAEDVGPAAPANYKILEKSLTLRFLNSGMFSLSKPNKGFPVGSYRLEIYFGDKLARAVKFSVQAP